MPVSFCASWRGLSCQGGSRSLAPGLLTSFSLGSTRCRVLSLKSPDGAKVTSLLTLPGRLLSLPGDCLLLSMLPPWPCSAAHTRMEFSGKAQPLRNLRFLACCLRLELRACRLLGARMLVTPWGSTGPGAGPALGCCSGKRVTATTDRVIKRQNTITNRLLPRSLLQSQDAMSPAVAEPAEPASPRSQPALQLIPPPRPPLAPWLSRLPWTRVSRTQEPQFPSGQLLGGRCAAGCSVVGLVEEV